MNNELETVKLIAQDAQQAAHAAAREMSDQRRDLADMLSRLRAYERPPAMSQVLIWLKTMQQNLLDASYSQMQRSMQNVKRLSAHASEC